MRKILWVLAILVALSANTVMAAGTSLTYTISDAQKYAIEHSTQAAIDDLDIKAKEIEIQIAKDNKITNSTAHNNAGLANNRIINEVKPYEADINLDIAKRNKEENKRKLALDVKKAAYKLVLLKKEKELEEKKLVNLKVSLETIKTKLKLGLITENDVIDSENKVDNKKNYLTELEGKYSIAVMEFKRLLNLPYDEKNVLISDVYIYTLIKDFDVNEAISTAIANNLDLHKRNKALEIKNMIMEIDKVYFNQGNSTYDSANYDLESAKLDVDGAKRQMEDNIRNKYNDLLTLEDKINITDRYEKLVQKKVKFAEVKYKNGLISKEMLQAEKEKLLDAGYQKQVAVFNYIISRVDFDYLLGK
jgi:outer membrane protein TolC